MALQRIEEYLNEFGRIRTGGPIRDLLQQERFAIDSETRTALFEQERKIKKEHKEELKNFFSFLDKVPAMVERKRLFDPLTHSTNDDDYRSLQYQRDAKLRIKAASLGWPISSHQFGFAFDPSLILVSSKDENAEALARQVDGYEANFLSAFGQGCFMGEVYLCGGDPRERLDVDFITTFYANDDGEWAVVLQYYPVEIEFANHARQ